MTTSFCVALAIVLVIGLEVRSGHKLGLALRATARWLFLLFWLASAGSALATLFGSKFQALAWLYYSFVGPPRTSLIFFGIAVFWTYLLALLSIRRVVTLLGPKICRIL
jgi:hypothetical protein